MANLFDILKTYRPRRVIQSDDFNDLNSAIKASFQKLGDAPATGEKGVSTAFTVGTPTLSNHAVPKSVMEAAETGVITNKNATDAAAAAALASQNAAALSETNASTSETNSAASAVTSGAAQVAAETAKTGAETAQAAALVSQNASGVSETNAATSASAGATSATQAAASSVTSANEAVASAGSATASSASQVAAAASAVTAQTAATNADASWDYFDARMLGAYANNPTTANDGSALVTGALYFNTTTNAMMVWSSSSWGAAGSAVNGTSERQTYTVSVAGQTEFASTHDVGLIDVYLSGAKLLQGTDFTSDGTKITLSSGAAINDTVDLVAYGAFQVANHYTMAVADSLFGNFNVDGGNATSTFNQVPNTDGGNA